MLQIYRHMVCIIIVAAYLCAAITPVIERETYQSFSGYTSLLKNKGNSSYPGAKSNPEKIHQRFVKAKDGFSHSPGFSEKPSTDIKINNSSAIHSSNSENACLFLTYTSLTNRAPPVL